MRVRIPRNPTDLPNWVRKQEGDRTVPLDKSVLDVVVRIVGDIPADNLLGRTRGTIGTGFVLAVPSETIRGQRWYYVLTAHHVIDGESHPQLQATNPFAPDTVYDPVSISGWRQPLDGVDLAIAPLDLDPDESRDQVIHGLAIEEKVFPPDFVPKLGAVVHYVGYLEPLNRMMVRTGAIGALEETGVRHSQPEYDYECHLVDCRSYGGFSGSPVFMPQPHPSLEPMDHNDILALPRNFNHTVGALVHIAALCGMFTEHLDDHEPNPDGTVSRYGVGLMLPSREIWRALMTDEAREERREWDEELKRSQENGPSMRPASVETDDDEYARFERLAQQLVSTPKTKPQDGQ